MNFLRNALIGGILVIGFLLFIRWNEFQEKHQPEIDTTQPVVSSTANQSIPAAPDVSAPQGSDIPEAPSTETSAQEEQQPKPVSAQLVSVSTDSLAVTIDTHGGDIVRVALNDYDAKLNDSSEPFTLLNNTDSFTYVAQSGLVGPDGTDGKVRPLFRVKSTSYTLGNNEDKLTVDLSLVKDNVHITKRFTFSRGSHLIELEYLIHNQSDKKWQANLFGQIKRDSYNPDKRSGLSMRSYLGAAITTTEKNYQKVPFKDLDEKPFKADKQGGWIAMIQHYFISAWIPDPDTTNHYNLRKSKNQDLYLLGFTSDPTVVAANSTGSIKASFYAGPKIIRDLEKISPHLDLTIDFGWLWMIAKPLFFALEWFHGLIGNWGLSIILLTCCIKALFFYPSAMSYRSMAKMRKVQPLMQELKDRFGDDRQRMSAELMQLYKREKVNPLGGCLPILLQMPVFLALYWMIMETVELRHSPFFFWIHDLSVKDPFYVLPLLMGITMFIQQKLNPTPPDPMQAKIMQLMPIFFTGLFMMFPAGLVLYWVVNNTLSITQQYYITRQIEKAG